MEPLLEISNVNELHDFHELKPFPKAGVVAGLPLPQPA